MELAQVDRYSPQRVVLDTESRISHSYIQMCSTTGITRFEKKYISAHCTYSYLLRKKSKARTVLMSCLGVSTQKSWRRHCILIIHVYRIGKHLWYSGCADVHRAVARHSRRMSTRSRASRLAQEQVTHRRTLYTVQ